MFIGKRFLQIYVGIKIMDKRESIKKITEIMKDNGFEDATDLISTHIYETIIPPTCFSEGPPMAPKLVPWA